MLLRFKNLDPDGSVLVDMRFSNGGIPFDELSQVPGFPRSIGVNEIVEIETQDCRELLYRRTMPNQTAGYLYCLFRVGLEHSRTSQDAYIRPWNRIKYPI